MKNHYAIIKLLRAGFLTRHYSWNDTKWLLWINDNIYYKTSGNVPILWINGFGNPEEWKIKEQFYSGAEALLKVFEGCEMQRDKKDYSIVMNVQTRTITMCKYHNDDDNTRTLGDYFMNKDDYYAEDWVVYNLEVGNET